LIVAHDPLRGAMVVDPHHQPAWKNSDAALEHAHIYVHLEARYILALKKGGGECDDGRIGTAQKFLHIKDVWWGTLDVEQQGGNMLMKTDAKAKPHDRLASYLAEDMNAVGDLIRTRMASKHAPRIPEVTAHLVEAGGKRLRPMLTLAAARMCGYDGPYHVHLAATVEFIHTATLLHDDVVDESAQRRGRPTANLLWDNKSSVLVGDYLFARSFQLMTETGSMRVLDILANASATIAEGEVLQLTAAQNLATDEAIYLQVVRGKTAALFSAATEVGGVIAGASDDAVQALFDYGDALGIAFQIVDDLLDYRGQTGQTGKNIGDDFRERKLTLPVIKAVAKADDEERAFWTRTIEKGRQQDGDLEQAIALLHKHDTLNETEADARAWARKAKAALDALPDHDLRTMLRDLADYVVARIS
jgi:octaprenyl-diphosphate synthase